jgi:hypothetical protein
MNNERTKELSKKGLAMMTEGYTCAEATLKVLLEETGLPTIPCQWAAAGYSGAIHSGKTTCGILFGATAFLGFMFGQDSEEAPTVQDAKRKNAIVAVNNLYKDFLTKFNETECKALTGCDFRIEGDVKRFVSEEIKKKVCVPQFEYVISYCLDQLSMRK